MPFLIKKEDIEAEINNYSVLGFFRKSKNQLVAFIVFISLLSLLMINILSEKLTAGGSPTQNYEIYIGIGLYFIMAIFVYFNHRWAIICFALFYAMDKVYLILGSIGFPVGQIIFGIIGVALSYNAFRVATALKKQQKSA